MARIQNLNMIYTLKEWKRFHSHLIGENWNQIERESVGWKSNFFVLGGNSQFKTQHKIHSNFLPPWISLNIIMTNIGLLLNFEYFQMQGNRGEVCCVALCFRTFKEKVKKNEMMLLVQFNPLWSHFQMFLQSGLENFVLRFGEAVSSAEIHLKAGSEKARGKTGAQGFPSMDRTASLIIWNTIWSNGEK